MQTANVNIDDFNEFKSFMNNELYPIVANYGVCQMGDKTLMTFYDYMLKNNYNHSIIMKALCYLYDNNEKNNIYMLVKQICMNYLSKFYDVSLMRLFKSFKIETIETNAFINAYMNNNELFHVNDYNVRYQIVEFLNALPDDMKCSLDVNNIKYYAYAYHIVIMNNELYRNNPEYFINKCVFNENDNIMITLLKKIIDNKDTINSSISTVFKNMMIYKNPTMISDKHYRNYHVKLINYYCHGKYDLFSGYYIFDGVIRNLCKLLHENMKAHKSYNVYCYVRIVLMILNLRKQGIMVMNKYEDYQTVKVNIDDVVNQVYDGYPDEFIIENMKMLA